jgi:ribosomal protein S18 acetylase RimI-like enzyme
MTDSAGVTPETNIDGSGPNVVVRLTTVDDAEQTFELFSQSLEADNSVSALPQDMLMRRPTSPAAMWELLMRWGPCAVALVDDHVVGFLLSDSRDPHVLELVNLFVDPSFRGRGYARQMLDLVEERSVEDGFRTVITTVSRNWDPDKLAIDEFYIHHGYEGILLNAELSLYLMRKDLSSAARATQRVRIVLE